VEALDPLGLAQHDLERLSDAAATGGDRPTEKTKAPTLVLMYSTSAADPAM
jgi:hypothetical protein